MANGDENKEDPFGGADFSSLEAKEETPVPTTEVPVIQPTPSTDPFTGTDFSSLKKKEQITSTPTSTSELVGSTSELEGSILASQEKRTDTPIILQADVDSIGAQLQESIVDQPQDVPKFLPDTPTFRDIKTSTRKSQKIENIIRRAVISNPDILDSEELDDAVVKKISDVTGDETLAKESLESLRTLRREKDLILTATDDVLDVTPNFNTPEFLNQIRKANSENIKQDLIAIGGVSEEDAETQSKILFPEEEISKSVELGINIDKVKNDYRAFLEKTNPEKLNDINSAARVGNFEGERAMTFMREALTHQANILDAKRNIILSDGPDNLTDQDIDELERIEDQRRRLGDRFKGVMIDFPELQKKAANEKIAQQRVDDSYKRAKANALLPNFEGTKARAEVLYQQVISPTLSAAVGLVENIAQLGTNQVRGISDNEIIQGTAGMMGDWVTGFFDTEKSSSIYKKPSELKGGLFENGDLQAEKLVPKVSETLFQMFALLEGGAAGGTALESAGLGANISQKLGLIASSFVQTQNDYFEEAKALGMSDNEANNFGNSASLLTSTLELINPQRHIFGKEGKKVFTKQVFDALKGGVDMKSAIKQNAQFVAKEIIGENAQEFAQEAGDLGVKYLFNSKNQNENFDVSVTQDELKELILLTSIVSGAGASGGVKSRTKLESESLFSAAQDIDKFRKFLSDPENEKNFSPEQLKAVSEKVTEYKKVVDGLPKNLDQDSKIELANLVFNKKKLNESKTEVFTDDVVSSNAGNDIEAQVSEIDEKIGAVFNKQKETNLDKKLPNLKLEKEGAVEYKVGNQLFSESEVIEKLSDDGFVKSVQDGETDLTISNPSPEVSQFLENSGLLTNKQLQTIKTEPDGEKTKKTEEARVEKPVLEKPPKEKEPTQPVSEEISDTDFKEFVDKGTVSDVVLEGIAEKVKDNTTLTERETAIFTDKTTEVEGIIKEKFPTIEIPQEKIDKATELGFTEDAISKLTEDQVDNIIKDEIKFTEDLDLKTVGKPVIGKAKIAEGFDELLTAIGGKANITANMFNQPSAFNALQKIAEGIVEETGFQGEKLINEIKVRLKKILGDKFQESDVDDVSKEIADFTKTIKKIDEEVIEKEVAEKKVKEVKQVAKKEEKVKAKEQVEKQAGFQKRTLEQAENTPAKEQVKLVVEENKQFYTVMNIADTVDQASKNIEREGGFESAFERMISEKANLDELAVLQAERQLSLDFYGNELDKAVKDGRKRDANKAFKRANALQEIISRDATRAGQANAMLQIWKALRPDGTVDFMNRKIEDHNNKLRDKKPKGEKETIGKTIDNFENFINELTADQINQILESPQGKSIIDEIVSKNKPSIKSELEVKLKRRKQKIDSVVNRLDSLKIKGDKLFVLPPGINLLPDIWNGSIEIIKKSIQAGETMASAIEKAIVFIKSKVGEEDFGEQAYRNQFSAEKKSLDADADISPEIDKALKELGTNIKDVINKHYTEKEELERSLTEKLIEDAGISKENAEEISKIIQEEFKEKIRKKSEQELSKALGLSRIPVKKKVKKLVDDLIDKINLGALNTEFFNGLFAEKFGLAKPLTLEQRVELKRLADIVNKQESGSVFERDAIMEMLKFMDTVYPTNNIVNTFFSLWYASLLSGLSTTALNLWSAGSNIIGRPIRDMLNLSRWYGAAKKGIQNRSIKDFLAYAPFNDMFYMPVAIAHGSALGVREFAETWKNGDVDSKFIEQVANKKFSKLNPLEKETYGKNAFKPINITIAGTKISLNPFNYYKFVGRALAAQDRLMFRMSHDIEMTSLIREQQLEKGLRGSELRKAVIDEYTQRTTDLVAAREKLDKEIEQLEKDTGKKVSKSKKKIRFREILESNLDPEILETAETLGRSNIFTDQRGGTIAHVASWIGKMSNQNVFSAIALKPWVPFTRVVGNVSEYMMDTIPLYGQMRANGASFSVLLKRTGLDVNTAQMGVPGSKEYYEQMGRAWLGTIVFTVASMLLVGSDEEDDFYITGGFSPDKFKRGRENVTPKYTLVINGFEVPYLNIPGLAIPLAMVGNYNDRLNFGDSEESLQDRVVASGLNSVFLMKEMSFLKGIQDLMEMTSDITSGKVSTTDRAKKELYKKYFLTLTKPLPQNFNLVDQIEKLYDPTSFSQKDITDITAYGLGVQRFLNNPSLDVFGEEIKTLPGETLLPYAHWLGLKGDDERWKFLSKHNAIPNKVSGNQEIYFIKEDGEEERRKPEKEELFEYTKLAGKFFNESLLDFMSQGGFEELEAEEVIKRGKKITGMQDEISILWSNAKFDARDELFSE